GPITTFPALVLLLSSQIYQDLGVSSVLSIFSCTLAGTVIGLFLALENEGVKIIKNINNIRQNLRLNIINYYNTKIENNKE
ncbi:MAG: hypothetical protein IKX70_06605, partial [Treponema sp.]|nr:hypothetical protein [Treponema sp.]